MTDKFRFKLLNTFSFSVELLLRELRKITHLFNVFEGEVFTRLFVHSPQIATCHKKIKLII